MPQYPDKSQEKLTPIGQAWLKYMGYSYPAAKLREQFDEIRRIKSDETPEETDLRIKRTEIQEKKLKRDFLDEIRNGSFRVYGRDITNGISARISEIPNAIFEEHDPDFSINWDLNKVFADGRTIIEVGVVPSVEIANPVQSKNRGRPASQGIEQAIERCVIENPKFWAFTQKVQCDFVRQALFGADVDQTKPPKGFADGAIKKRLRKWGPSQKS